MNDSATRGAKLTVKKGIGHALLDFLEQTMESKGSDAVLIPVKVPAGNSYAWILTSDKAILEEASPVAPVMPVQGAKALKSLTRKGTGEINVVAVMRPCEIRGTLELMKLNQVHLDRILLVSYDCAGAIPFQDYVRDPGHSEESYEEIMTSGEPGDEKVKPACRICTEFSLVDSDIHFGYFGCGGNTVFAVPVTEKGKDLLESMKMDCTADLSSWSRAVAGIREKRVEKRKEVLGAAGTRIQGLGGLIKAFDNCIGCHNCMSVCPICYCRQCYFDSEVSKKEPDYILETAIRRGGVSFPRDRVMFHTGRMTHMSLSCVSCGMCTDACPVDIPVAEIFSYMADITQPTFEYAAGRNDGVSLPLRKYEEKEVARVHDIVKGAEEVEASHE